ncbi:MAG: alpha-1,2-fucosyltransferase [Bacteroidia bacterium]|nr:alpha-1,2-fucosyltransferase [Bacteroidia bacterium]
MIRLMGGLGNQMFQYAFGRMLSQKYQAELVLDDTLLKDRAFPDAVATHRDFALDVFKLAPYRMAVKEEIDFYNGQSGDPFRKRIMRYLRNRLGYSRLIVQKGNQFHDFYLKPGDNHCLVGRWQGEIYFSEIAQRIRQEFQLKDILSVNTYSLGKEIKQQNSLAIHIRRGDLLTSPLYAESIGALELKYYRNAAEILFRKAQPEATYVFSDDPDWCVENFSPGFPVTVVPAVLGHPNGVGHLHLMSCCRHHIISNSTFAWWAAWLKEYPEGITVGPRDWFRDPELFNPVIFPENWIRV